MAATGADRFLVDAMCGTLATHLRMCGYDVVYALDRSFAKALDRSGEDESHGERATEPPARTDPSDETILAVARAEDRRVVTRDRHLADRADDAILLRTRDLDGQLRGIRRAGYDLRLPDEPVRCSECNGRLDAVDADGTTPEYAPDPVETAVWRCPDCGQCFWRGSHWDAVAARLASL